MDIVSYMLDYQRENCIKGNCVSNSYFLMTFINRLSGKIIAKTKPVIVIVYKDKEKNIIEGVIVHLVVEVDFSEGDDDEKIKEPSYEPYTHKYTDYVIKISALPKGFSKLKKYFESVVKNFLKFVDLSEKINNRIISSEEIIIDKDYYRKQAEYVRNRVKKDFQNSPYLKNILECLI